MLRNDHLFVTIDIYFCFTRTTEHYTYLVPAAWKAVKHGPEKLGVVVAVDSRKR